MKSLLRLLALALFAEGLVQAAPPRPNIVFILADDLGWADVGFHGGRAPTPNIDALAKQSVELTQHYVYPVCSPTRSALLSGRYATRFGVTTPQAARAYPWGTVTLASALRDAGYDTALFGKWHLGSKPEWGPQKFGFARSYGSLGGGVGPWNHRYKLGEFTHTWHRDGELIEEEGHVTDLIAREAERWLAERGDRPFLLYLPFTAVHIPIREPEEIVRRVPAAITAPVLREYAADIMHLDDAVGRVLAALEKTGRAENTIVVFSSDNGGIDAENADDKYPPDNYEPGAVDGNNLPLRGKKGDVYEGGIRVPTLVRWPARLKPGKVTAPVHISDWMPTFCALAGSTPSGDLHWDGQNIAPLLTGEAKTLPRTIYTAGPSFRDQALRDGDLKLVVHHPGAGKKAAKAAADIEELYDLANDPNETTDLAPKQPEKVAALRAKLADVSRADRDAQVTDAPAAKE